MTTNATKTENNVARFDRHHYGSWRRQWRADYAQLSERIRSTRTDCRNQQRDNEGHSPLQASLPILRRRAAEMMEERTEIDTLRRDLAKRMNLVAPDSMQVAAAA